MGTEVDVSQLAESAMDPNKGSIPKSEICFSKEPADLKFVRCQCTQRKNGE